MLRSTTCFPVVILYCVALFLASNPAAARQNSSTASTPAAATQTREAASDQCNSANSMDGAAAGDTVADQENANPPDFDRDLKFLQQEQSNLGPCAVATGPDSGEQTPEHACAGAWLMNFEMRHDGDPERDIPIGRIPGTSAFFYESGMTIDADGAPNAYHPENLGLDDLANAGTPGRWEGLAKDPDGQPYIQGPKDPFPGYYVSATALMDRTKAVNDPARYVDASKIPFVVLPGGMARQLGARPGDFAAVFNPRNGRSSFAIFGDVGPFDRIGEGSMALAENLGIRSDARNGGARRGILYLVFPGSGDRTPRTVEEIEAEGRKLLLGWQASVLSPACTAQREPGEAQGTQAAN